MAKWVQVIHHLLELRDRDNPRAGLGFIHGVTVLLIDIIDWVSHLPGARPVPVFAQPDSLPGAEVQFPVWHWHRQVGAEEASFHVGRLEQEIVNFTQTMFSLLNAEVTMFFWE